MAGENCSEITQILKRIQADGDSNYDVLLPLLYEELRNMAGAYLRQERLDHTLQPTALVHEAYMKLVEQPGLELANRGHFLAVAARAMRQILVDHARHHRAAKRGGSHLKVSLNDAVTPFSDGDVELIALSDALTELEKLNVRKARVVELRFFGGLTHEESARELDVSRKTVEADWYMARAWLRRALGGESSN